VVFVNISTDAAVKHAPVEAISQDVLLHYDEIWQNVRHSSRSNGRPEQRLSATLNNPSSGLQHYYDAPQKP
jgi:hypothetical protein